MWWTILGTAAATLGAAVIVANTSWVLPRQSPYNFSLLKKSRLKRLSGEGTGEMSGEDLWKKSGAEAAKLSSLQPELSSKGVPLYGIVHEEKGANSFNKYLNGQMLFDEEKVFYGPKITTMGLLGLVRLATYQKYWTAYSSGVEGNIKGDGTILGSTLVVGPGDQGILYEYRAREFGDMADVQDVLKAIKKIE